MSGLMEKQMDLQDILERGGVHTVAELADELNMEKVAVRKLVRVLRKKFLSGISKLKLMFIREEVDILLKQSLKM